MIEQFLRKPGRPGAFGALLDETARAAADLCRVAETFDDARFAAERPSDNPSTRSPRAVCLHVVSAAHRYANYIRKARGVPHVERFELDPSKLVRAADLRPNLREALLFTEETVEDLHGWTGEQVMALAFTVRWGPRYDPEMILEHGLCHVLRHRRQLERW
jgi:hypothetical protein